jgi:hypothetical protein
MNSGSPVESRYTQPAATAARTAATPHLANGPTVATNTSSDDSTSANTVFCRSASAGATSSPPKAEARACKRSGSRPASTGRVPAATSRSATRRPV